MNKQSKYIDYKVYNITNIKDKYGFRVVLFYIDDKSKTIQKSGFKTKREANDERNKVIAELHNGTFVLEEKINVKKFFTFWLEEEMRPRITSNSYDAFKNVVYRYIIPKIGNIKMIDLNRSHIQNLYVSIAKQYHSIAKTCKTIMNTALNYALTKNIVSMNIAKNIDLPKEIKGSAFHMRNIDSSRTLTVEQVKTLIEKSKDTPLYLYVLFASLLGLRKSEIRGLKYEDIDYVKRTIKIQRQLGKAPNSDDIIRGKVTKQEIKLKTYSSNRELEIPDIIFEAVLEERKLYEQNKRRRINDKTYPFIDEGYICGSTYGNPRSKEFHYKGFKKLLNDAGLPNIRFHDLRSTYCTILVKNEFNLKAISKIMGHATEIISVDVYTNNMDIITNYADDIQGFIDRVTPSEIEGEKITRANFTDDADMIQVVKMINKMERPI